MNARPIFLWASLGVMGCAFVAACSKKPDPEAEAAALLGVQSVTEADRTQAKELFAARCLPCHGPTGGGDGPASANLTPKPRNFQDVGWQGSVTNEHITKIIRFGGASVGKSAAMPANPDLTEKRAVMAALTGQIRGFAK